MIFLLEHSNPTQPGLIQSSCCFLFFGIFSALRQEFSALFGSLLVCTWVLGEEGGGRVLIREPLVSRKCLFGTDCSEEIRIASAGEESEADHDMEPSVHNLSECPLCILFQALSVAGLGIGLPTPLCWLTVY